MTGLRFYTWKGVEYPSVTTIRRMAGMPFALHQWAVNKVIERATLETNGLLKILGPRDAASMKAAATWLRAASTEERDRKANVGLRIHDAAAQQKAIGEVADDIRDALRQYYNWFTDTGVKVLASERQVWNLTLGYAGTFDILVRFPDGTVYVVDIKTGNGTYPEHALQCVAYAMAEFIGENDEIDEPLTRLLLEANGIALLHLRDNGWKWQVINVTPELFASFRGLLTFAGWAHKYPTMAGLLEDEREGGT